jgi:N utilization substance protein B
VLESKISWINNPEVVKNIYNSLREKKYFQDYLGKETCTYNDDKDLLLNIIEDCFPTMAPLELVLEEISIFWNDDIDFILNMVHKTIKSFKETDGSEKKLMPLYKNDDDLDFTKKLFRKTYLNFEEYNELIKKHSQNWDFDRIAIMDILIMRMALAEILEFPSIPVKVSLNEYIEIAKDYSTTNSNTFINGILDNIVKDLKNTKRIAKTGRGLIDN